MTDSDRLKALRERAEGIGGTLEVRGPKGLRIIVIKQCGMYDGKDIRLQWLDDDYAIPIATTLLAALDPAAVRVKIERGKHAGEFNATLERPAYNCSCPFCNDEVMTCSRKGYCPAIKMPLGEDEEYIVLKRKLVR